MTTAFL